MQAILVVLALLFGIVGLTSLTQATTGVGLLSGACLASILARLLQANVHHTLLMHAVRRVDEL